MFTGGSAKFEENDDRRRQISQSIVDKISQVQKNNLESLLEAVRFIEASYPMNADPSLVPEVKLWVNSLFSDIIYLELEGPQKLLRADALTVLEVGGPSVEGKSGYTYGGYVFDNLLFDVMVKGELQNLFKKHFPEPDSDEEVK